MFIKKIVSVRYAVIVVCLSNVSIVPTKAKPQANYHVNQDVTAEKLRGDLLLIRKYILERVSTDLKKAKKWGKGMAKAFAGISHYAFDAIPFEFFVDNSAIEAVFRRLEEGAAYIQEKKEAFKRTMSTRKKLNQSQLAEFLYNHVVNNLHVTEEQRAVLRREPLKMDEWVRRGIVKKEEYMYYTLLNFVVRYYLEQEFKK